MPLSPLATRCPPDDANPVPWTRPAEPDNLRRYPASFLVSRHSAFLAVLDAGTPEITLQGRPPQMHPTAIPRLKRLAEAPKGAAPIVGSTPRTPFGILADPENDSATVRHRALPVEAHRDALGKAALAAWRRRTQAAAKTFRHSGTRGWSGVAEGRAAFLPVSPPVPIRSAHPLLQEHPKAAARGRVLLEALR
jgi:hypothetical protein